VIAFTVEPALRAVHTALRFDLGTHKCVADARRKELGIPIARKKVDSLEARRTAIKVLEQCKLFIEPQLLFQVKNQLVEVALHEISSSAAHAASDHSSPTNQLKHHSDNRQNKQDVDEPPERV
jgi:hypothetical protein